ncbi:MAG TPA: serine hydrolase domain-containing protein, partial [Hyphomicrobiaceae bacterium]|nr:serine hydrolase domain-containing protein [Hyphomicrobiaceae bacterium]
ERLRALGAPGVIIFVRRGSERWMATTGVADTRTKRSMTGKEVWRIASVTKLITAVAVQMLAAEKRLTLTDPVSKFLPRIVPLASRITIKHLLSQTSGIPDYLAGDNVPVNVSAAALARNLVRHRPRAALLADANRQKRRFAPGARHEYSNTNFLLLEMIIEKVTRQSFQKLLTAELIKPIGLTRTGFPDRDGNLPTPHIRGYVPLDTRKGPFTHSSRTLDVTVHDYFSGADGGLYSNIDDLGKMMDALWSGAIIAPMQLRAMTTDLKSDHEGMYRYGLGIVALPTRCGRKAFGHEGRDIGIFTTMLATEDGSRQLIVVVNTAIDYHPQMEKVLADLRDRVFCD